MQFTPILAQWIRIFEILASDRKRIFTFFEVNIKYISSRVLKTSEFSQVKILMFSTHKMKYIWYLLQIGKFSFLIYFS